MTRRSGSRNADHIRERPAHRAQRAGGRFLSDLPPGTYRFTVQPLSGIPTGYKDKVRLAPGTHAYLEIQWGPSWQEGQPGGSTFYVRTLSSQLGKAYFDSMRYVGPDRI